MGDAPKVRNLVHEMEVWKQRCAGELVTQKNWDTTWGFLKTPRTEDDGGNNQALKKVFDKFDVDKNGTMSIFEFSKMLISVPGQAPPEACIAKFFGKQAGQNLSLEFSEFVRMASALKAGKLPGLSPIDIVTMKKPSPSEMLEQSSQDTSMPRGIQKLLGKEGYDDKQEDSDVPTRFKQRLDKMKPPKERFAHPVTTQQEVDGTGLLRCSE